MSKKIRVGILFGGCSAEHEVSLQSAKNVVDALDKNKYEVVLIGIDKQGRWCINDSSQFLLNAEDPKLIKLNQSNLEVGLIPGRRQDQLIIVEQNSNISNLDVVFPILHGPLGEDGSIQGLLRLANLPFVGSSVLGSAICMDKDVTKRLLQQANLPICKYITLKKYDEPLIFSEAVHQLGLPIFIKPANMGSSIGVSKVNNEDDFIRAIELAFKYDNKILLEENVKGREIEISVLGNENPMTSVAGEIVIKNGFYSYDVKYIEDSAALEVPANISQNVYETMQKLAISAFKVLECKGLARCDFFLLDDGRVYINEINTMPGFTKISMYPRLWNVSGIAYSELISRLIDLALEDHTRDKALQTDLTLS
jgi:D-alanine-D-alanine ligase